ncbi:MAG: PD40 domain-containing protein [Saprospiraceae bacterium]|nr:PD40 domain-containing protein [Saprospiraceae bacterium]
MHRTSLILPFLVFFAWTNALSAQQSSKSKSKERFREKDDPNNIIRVRNTKELNSQGTDYSPVFYDNGLVFVSSRKKSGPQDKKSGETYSELYFSPFDPNGDPASPQKFSLEINSSLHEGPVTFSRDFKTMYFTRNNMHKGVQKADEKGVVRLKIYEAKAGVIDWVDVRELPFNSDSYSCLHPSLSADGKHLYFASDMPGGQGGYDIWVSQRSKEGYWGPPTNLGAIVNTPQNEVFPHIHISGTLFFSSNGHDGLGKLDIFRVDLDEVNREVFNLGEKFNSNEEDLAFVLDDDGIRGFFASDRGNGYGKDDIYSFSIEKGFAGAKPESQDLKIKVVDANTGESLQGAGIRILQFSEGGFVSGNNDVFTIDMQQMDLDQPNTLSMRVVRKDADDLGRPDQYTNVQGEATNAFTQYRQYMIVVTHEGYEAGEQAFSFEQNPQAKDIIVKLHPAGRCYRAGGVVLTDKMGTRINFANVRFTHKMSGKSQVVRSNTNGEFDLCLTEEGDYLVQIEREGFLPENYSLPVQQGQKAFNEVRMRPTEVGVREEELLPLASGIKTGSVMVMDRIKFEDGKATLNQSAVRHLDALYELMMRYPEMEIELTVHTDARGDAADNQTLSSERAKNCKTYLTYRGLAEKRIQASGKGESEIRNRCTEGVECSEEEHKNNQRIEVKVKRIGA